MSGCRMKTAARFKGCIHLGCFDLHTLVQINQRSRKVTVIIFTICMMEWNDLFHSLSDWCIPVICINDMFLFAVAMPYLSEELFLRRHHHRSLFKSYRENGIIYLFLIMLHSRAN